jgi:hypothetical protein
MSYESHQVKHTYVRTQESNKLGFVDIDASVVQLAAVEDGEVECIGEPIEIDESPYEMDELGLGRGYSIIRKVRYKMR